MRREIHKKYFWDGDAFTSGPYRLRRILEYGSFPDLLAYPFDEIKRNLPFIDIDNLRTGEKRKRFLRLIFPLVKKADTWDKLFDMLINPSGSQEDKKIK